MRLSTCRIITLAFLVSGRNLTERRLTLVPDVLVMIASKQIKCYHVSLSYKKYFYIASELVKRYL